MINEFSYGIIPLRLQEKIWEVLLIQHHSGHWSFPKGHAEKGELPKQAAARELEEETGLVISSYLSDEILTENYSFFFQKKKVYKTVQYFLAKVEGEIRLQESEISASQWVPVSQAANYVTFREAKSLCWKVQKFLENETTI